MKKNQPNLSESGGIRVHLSLTDFVGVEQGLCVCIRKLRRDKYRDLWRNQIRDCVSALRAIRQARHPYCFVDANGNTQN